MMKRNEIRIAFFGTPRFSVFVLEALQHASLTPSLIVTVPDKPADRGLLPKASAVKEWAEKKDIPVIQPEKLGSSNEEADILLNSEWDLFIVAGYGKILPASLIKIPTHGVLNVHPSLLPKFRGPSPIETQIFTDTKEVGVSIILLDEETDHGPILAQASITPDPWPFKRSMLEDLLWQEGGNLLAEAIPLWMQGELPSLPQNHDEATFTAKLKKEDGRIDLKDNAYQNYLKFCAYEGWPGTYFFIERGEKKIRVKIIDATYLDDTFTPLVVTPEGKREMNYKDFLRG